MTDPESIPPPVADPEAAGRLALELAARNFQPEPEPEIRTVDPLAALSALAARITTTERAEDWAWRNETIPRLRESGFSQRHWIRNIEWHPTQRKVFELCRRLCIGRGAVVALVGLRGTGKTTICAQMARERAEDYSLPPWSRAPGYRKLSDLLARYKPLYADFGSTALDSLQSGRDAFCRGSLVFIDEIHECANSKIAGAMLTDLIDRRYSACKDTILISNQTQADFENTIGDSIKSRLQEHGKIIPCNWESFRESPQPTTRK